MSNCKENAISYAPIYFNLIINILYFILQHFRHKHNIKKIENIEKEITSSQKLESQRNSININDLKNIINEYINDIEKNNV